MATETRSRPARLVSEEFELVLNLQADECIGGDEFGFKIRKRANAEVLLFAAIGLLVADEGDEKAELGNPSWPRRRLSVSFADQTPKTSNSTIWQALFEFQRDGVKGAINKITVCAGFHELPDLVSVLVSVADPLTPKPLLHTQFRMEPMAGIEPATDGLRNRCSTTELHWRTSAGG